tara:strand:+ start:257 stop:721 length:465 start_codon:yes stop_codon:yes gene_type:complete
MAAVAIAGVGIMMVCCSSSSIAFLMMGGEEKKVPDGNDAAGEAQAKADAVAADPNSTPEEVAAAQAEADTNSGPTPAERAAAKKAADAAAAVVAKEAWIRSNCEPCHRQVRCDPPTNECYGCYGRNEKREHATHGKCPHSWEPCPGAPEGPCPG